MSPSETTQAPQCEDQVILQARQFIKDMQKSEFQYDSDVAKKISHLQTEGLLNDLQVRYIKQSLGDGCNIDAENALKTAIQDKQQRQQEGRGGNSYDMT